MSAWGATDPAAAATPPASLLPTGRDVFLLEAVRVVPDTREASLLVRRGLDLRVGEPVAMAALIDSKARLEATGHFEKVEVHTERGSEPGAVVLVAEVEVGPRFQFESGIGREDFAGWYLNLFGFRWTSPLRRGEELRFGIHSGLEISGSFLDLEVPEIGGKHTDLLVGLAAFERTWFAHDGSQEFSQTIAHARSSIGLRHRLGEHTRTTLSLGRLRVDPEETITASNDEEFPATLLLPPSEPDRLSEVRAEFLYDRREPGRDWQDRTWAGTQLRVAQVDDGAAFWSLEADGRVARPLPFGGAAAFRLHSAWTGAGTPYHQRFALGGARSLRGFDHARLSGPRGADAFWAGSAEWRQPLLLTRSGAPRVLGTLFTDLGDHWDDRGRRGGLAAGCGYGVQIQIPWIQVVTIEASFPLTNERSSDPVALYVLLGRSF